MSPAKKIVVIRGGIASEREISLRSGAAVALALRARGHVVREFDPAEEDLTILSAHRPDLAFIALHGAGGEDGSIQGALEVLRIPYTGCGVMASALCYDKILTKQALKPYKVPTPAAWVYNTHEDLTAFVKSAKITLPVIVKPSREGSTIGITIVKKKSDLCAAIIVAAKYCEDILIESFIRGRELTSGIVDGQSLPLVEIAPKSGFYDYKSKYTKGQTEYILPARISDVLSRKINALTERIYHRLGCRGAARADYIVDKKGTPWFLEINTIPGMTETSLLPKAAVAAGMDFGDLCERIMASATLDIYGQAPLPSQTSRKSRTAASMSEIATASAPLNNKGLQSAGPAVEELEECEQQRGARLLLNMENA